MNKLTPEQRAEFKRMNRKKRFWQINPNAKEVGSFSYLQIKSLRHRMRQMLKGKKDK